MELFIPTLIYDGDCGFCQYWVDYWKQLTGKRVAYVPYQKVEKQYPQISRAEFQRAIQYVTDDNKVSSAAEASFLTLSHAQGGGLGLWLYRHVPGFAKVAEATYTFIAKRRPLFHKISTFLWGRELSPSKFHLTSWLFLRGLGLIYCAAFVSFAVQSMALIGSRGIIPIAETVAKADPDFGIFRFWLVPMLFWFNTSDIFISFVGWGGAVLSLLVVANIGPRVCLLLAYIFYLSLSYAGQNFMTFQWDSLLTEVGIIGLILSFAVKPGIWLLRWLMLRFMLMGGLVKIFSGDVSWHNLTALNYYFETQPIPTPLAWYFHHLPPSVLAFLTGAVLFIELVLPFFVLLPRHLRFTAAFGFLLLQSIIILTGNYNFFNLLVLICCLALFDDKALQHVIPQRLQKFIQKRSAQKPNEKTTRRMKWAAGFLIFVGCLQLMMFIHLDPPAPLAWFYKSISGFRIVNSYGPFAVMTKERNEIIIEGSNDGKEWKEYEFKYKPGDVTRRPPWNIPHQPRVDWQFWFAALEQPARVTWLPGLYQRLLEGEPHVLALLAKNPFPDQPPVFLRARFYKYNFASPDDKSKGFWWQRELIGDYAPQMRLTSPTQPTIP